MLPKCRLESFFGIQTLINDEIFEIISSTREKSRDNLKTSSRLRKLVEKISDRAYFQLGKLYLEKYYESPQKASFHNYKKALEIWKKISGPQYLSAEDNLLIAENFAGLQYKDLAIEFATKSAEQGSQAALSLVTRLVSNGFGVIESVEYLPKLKLKAAWTDFEKNYVLHIGLECSTEIVSFVANLKEIYAKIVDSETLNHFKLALVEANKTIQSSEIQTKLQTMIDLVDKVLIENSKKIPAESKELLLPKLPFISNHINELKGLDEDDGISNLSSTSGYLKNLSSSSQTTLCFSSRHAEGDILSDDKHILLESKDTIHSAVMNNAHFESSFYCMDPSKRSKSVLTNSLFPSLASSEDASLESTETSKQRKLSAEV